LMASGVSDIEKAKLRWDGYCGCRILRGVLPASSADNAPLSQDNRLIY
jgi:hypothetical protein